MDEQSRILVATDNVDDADLVCSLLEDAYPQARRSIDPDRFAADFDDHRPQVLIIAFKKLEAAERYYLGLYRNSALVNELPHRTLILCGKEDVARVYAQCCREYFDDYVLFWPLVHDAPRLPMSVRLALRALGATHSETALAQLAAQARRIGALEAQLDRQIALGAAHAGHAQARVLHAHALVSDAPAATNGAGHAAAYDSALRPTASLIDPDTPAWETGDRDPPEKVDPIVRVSLERAVRSIEPIQHWIGGLKSELAAPLKAVQALTEQARKLSRLILVVDDDTFMRNLLSQVLTSAGYEVDTASTVAEMMAVLRRRRADLIVMDVMLPGLDGIDGTRKLKTLPAYADIPVIMLTGQKTKQSIVDSLKAGAVDYVVKPFDRDSFLKKVERRIEG